MRRLGAIVAGLCCLVASEAMAYQIIAAPGIACMVVPRSELKQLGVPSYFKVKALNICAADEGYAVVYGTGKKGEVRCEGTGDALTGGFEACGVVW